MKIAIFGGSFDPPHFIHYFISRHLIHSGLVDKIVFVPAYKHPFKKASQGSYEDRYRMTMLLSSRGQRLTGSAKAYHFDRDLKPAEQGKTFFVMKKAQKYFPKDKLFLIIGSDILDETDKWFNFEEIKNNWPIIIYGRAGYDSNLITVPISLPNISSTDIRNKIKKRENVSYLVPQSILEYIDKSKTLYKEEEK